MNVPLLALTVKAMTGLSVRWNGFTPSLRQRVYFANHTSHLDSLVLWAALPAPVRKLVRPAAAKDYWGANKALSYLATEIFNAVLIERNRVTRHNHPLESALEAMGERYSLIFFPEGKRNPGPEVGEFRGGLYHLRKMRPDLELVPVYIENLNRILPKGEFLPLPLLSSITFGSPIRAAKDEPKGRFLERARSAICNLKDCRP